LLKENRHNSVKSLPMFTEFDMPIQEAFFLPKYLDVPIIDTDLRLFDMLKIDLNSKIDIPKLKYPLAVSKPLADFCSRTGLDHQAISRVEPSSYPDIWHSTPYDTAFVITTETLSNMVCKPVIEGINQFLKTSVSAIDMCPTASFMSSGAQYYLGRLLWWYELIGTYDEYRSKGGRNHLTWSHQGFTVTLSTKLCFFQNMPGLTGPCCLTYDQLLGLKDALHTRANIAVASACLYKDKPSIWDSLCRMWQWQEKCLLLYGNQGYELAKSTESLSKTYLSFLIAGDKTDPQLAYPQMLEKHRTKERKVCLVLGDVYPSVYLADMYHDTVLSSLTDFQEIVELFGCQKCISHPLINVYAGGKSAAGEARERDTTLLGDALDLRATFCRIFVESYVKRHNAWPKLKHITKGSILHDLYSRGVLSFNRQSIPLSDWYPVRFTKLFDFDYYPNFLDIVDDKSINVNKSERMSAWDNKVKATTERRMLLEVLRRTEVDHKAMLDLIDDGLIPEEFKTVALTPKEREFKLQARMFCMLVLDIRDPATICEANLATCVLPYIPQLTMTDDKLTTHQRFLDLTRRLHSEDLVRLFIELDLSRWNLRWRELCIGMLGADFNDMFGVKRLFTWIHKYFSECMVYVRSANAKPDGMETDVPPESDLLWYNHLGGFEGIAQKLWSIATVAMIARGIDDLPISYTMTAQGDNVVLTVTSARDFSQSKAGQIRELTSLILTRCSIYSSKVNQDLKPEECIHSEDVITYSKAVYIAGVDYPTTLKSLSRLFPTASVEFPCPEAFIRSIFAGSLAAAEQSKNGLACYSVGMALAVLACRLMRLSCGPYTAAVRSTGLGKKAGITRHILTMPACLGGYTVSGWYDYLYRGTADPLSKAVASLWTLRNSYPAGKKILGTLQQGGLYQTKPSLRSLVLDPYGLPIRKPTTPEDAVAETTLEVIGSTSRNQAILDVIKFGTDTYEEELLHKLSLLTPFNPVIAHDLYDCSVLGTKAAIAKMFLTTRTIQILSRSVGCEPITSTLVQAAIKGLHHQVTSMSHCDSGVWTEMSLFSLITTARQSWDSCGVCVSGITSYMPCDFDIRSGPVPYNCEILVHAPLPLTDPRYTRGDNRAYLGTRTKEKRSDHGYKIIGRSYAVSAIKNLQRIYAWSDHSAGIGKIISHLSLTRGPIDVVAVSSCTDHIIGGSTSHRYAARSEGSGAYIMGQTTFASHCLLDSDNAGYLSATKDDYPIMFQEFYLYLIALADLVHETDPTRSIVEVRIRIGDEPLHILEGDRFSLSDDNTSLTQLSCIPGLVFDPYVRLSSKELIPSDQPFKLVRVGVERARFQALVSHLLAKVGSVRGAIGVMDHVAKRISLGFGVLELRGMGVQTYLSACACACLDTIGAVIHSSASYERRNASVSFLLLRYGDMLISPILDMVNHPSMSQDPLVQSRTLTPGPKYMTHVTSKSILLAELGRCLSQQLAGSRTLYHKYEPVLFPGAGVDDLMSAVVTLCRRSVSASLMGGRISHDEASLMIGSTVRLAFPSIPDEFSSRPQLVYEHLLFYSCTVSRRSSVDPTVQRTARRIALGSAHHQILITDLAPEELLRSYRSVEIVDISQTPKVLFDTLIPSGPYISSALSRSTLASCITRSTRWLYKYYRRRDCPAPLASGAFNTWYQLGRLFSGAKILVIGSGLGAIAAVAILAGCTLVHGHDLRETMPTSCIPTRYIPPLVSLVHGRDRYRQTVHTYETTGDWLNDDVAGSLSIYYSEYDIAVVDLSGPSETFVSQLVQLEKYSRWTQHLWRATGHETELAIALSLIERSFPIYQMWSTNNIIGLCEIVVWFGKRHVATTSYLVPQWPTSGVSTLFTEGLIVHPEVFVPKFLLRVSLSASVAAVSAYLGGPVGRTLRQTCHASQSMFVDMIRGASNRPTYDEWTRVLYSAVASGWMLIECEADRLALLHQWHTLQIAHTAVPEQYPVCMTQTLSQLLTDHANPLTQYLDMPYSSYLY
jgi:hypothetical protein